MVIAESSTGALGYFLPIFAFLLVFIIVYALMKKTAVLGGSEPIMLFISLVLASFFVVEASLVDFIQFNSAWFGVFAVAIFFVVALMGFIPGKEPLEILTKNDWFAWTILGLIVAFFVISSAYVFNWVINWEMLETWIYTDWFGLILLLVIAAFVSWKIKSK
jgi:hypothetical protein